ncbi:MAG: hypothetical protein M3Y74_19520, partial [Chloroflexota bacterium]|nr:hypothetical protein [Chloroflexota bacterium]
MRACVGAIIASQHPHHDNHRPSTIDHRPSTRGEGMAVEIRVPHFGESVTEAVVGRWLKKE